MKPFPGKLAIQQRVLASYRAPFFDALASACTGELSVCAGQPLPDESITVTDTLSVAKLHPVQNVHLLRGTFLLCYQRKLIDWLDDFNPDALITEVNIRTISTRAALKRMKRHSRLILGWGLGAPSLVSLKNLPTKITSTLYLLMMKPYLQNFDALITYSRRGAAEYASTGFPADRIFVAPNALTPRPTHFMPARPASFDGRPTVLFVGRLQARKQLGLLLHACSSLPEGIKPRLIIIGDGPERQSLVALAKQVYPQAEFPGSIHGPGLVPYFAAADLFVLPGTGGLAVQEAMSYGLPIIMGQGDGTNDELVRPENGWQLTYLDSLAEVLLEALSDVSRLRKMGEASFLIVQKEVNIEKMVSVFLSALDIVSTKKNQE
jgi:glycosyltransferase involved in cell wall biosynthesis